MVHVSAEVFDEAVADALDAIPRELTDLLDNVVVLVEDEPPQEDPDLAGVLGVYEGVPLTERAFGTQVVLPDRITLFRGPLVRMCGDLAELRDEIAVTVAHEVAHHFGIDDARLHELGWG